MTDNISLTINCEFDEEDDDDNNTALVLDYNISSTSDDDDDDVFLELNSNAAYAQLVNYDLNFTTKQLIQICDYYGVKTSKRLSKKSEILNLLVTFETTLTNHDIVLRRKQLWYYLNELKSDKYMKKFILW